MMNCSTFEERIDLLLGGDLTQQEADAAREHVGRCPRCRELLQIARGELDILPEDRREDLIGAVLERTSGSACRRVEDLLCDQVDGLLRRPQDELLALHLEHCAGCRALAETLRVTQLDLEGLAEVVPDEAFVSDVLDATLYRRGRWGRMSDAVASWWNRQIRRPLFVLEVSFSGAVLLFLLFGTPRSPLREVAPRAIEIVRANPVHSAVQILEYEGGTFDAVSRRGRDLWKRTGKPAVETAGRLSARASGTAVKIEGALEIIWNRGGKVARAVWGGDLLEAWRNASGTWGAIRDRWHGTTPPPADERGTEP